MITRQGEGAEKATFDQIESPVGKARTMINRDAKRTLVGKAVTEADVEEKPRCVTMEGRIVLELHRPELARGGVHKRASLKEVHAESRR